jgi:hypothetical protein
MASNQENRPKPAKLDLSRLAQIKIEHDIYKYLNSQYLSRTNMESELLDLDESLTDEKLGMLIREQVDFFRMRSEINNLNDKSLTVVSELSRNETKQLFKVRHNPSGLEMVKKVSEDFSI